MYDIQNALRRRAMAERLEALSRADEATARAVDTATATATETPSRGRHAAEAPARDTTRDPAGYLLPGPDLSGRVTPQRPETPPEAPGLAGGLLAPGGLDPTPAPAPPRDAGPAPSLLPPQHGAPATPANALSPLPPSPLGGTPTGPTGFVPRAPHADDPSDVPSNRTIETLLAVRAPDQTARLDVTVAGQDLATPPPLRGDNDVTAQNGLALLRGPRTAPGVGTPEPDLAEPATGLTAPAGLVTASEVTALTEAVEAVALLATSLRAVPVAPSPLAPAPLAPAPLAPAPGDLAADPPVHDDHTGELADSLTHGELTDEHLADDLTDEHLTDDDLADDEPPHGGSSAATIADLLRHGSGTLFFGGQRARP